MPPRSGPGSASANFGRSTAATPCRYHLSGGCQKGSSCPFSHAFATKGLSAKESNVCRFFLAGNCAYGSKCRYDHVRPKKVADAPVEAAQAPKPKPAPKPAPAPPAVNPWAARAAEAPPRAPPPPPPPADVQPPFGGDDGDAADDAAVARRQQALALSSDVECAICMDRVLAKENLSERRFGILTGCDHAFCLACIREWRSTTDRPGADIDGAVRACPLCRAPSHFVVPSTVWYADAEGKDAIVRRYVEKLGAIDCRHFDQGRGTCPFGSSCFYRHRYPDGTFEETALRKYGNAEGEVKVVQPVRLAEFLSRSNLL